MDSHENMEGTSSGATHRAGTDLCSAARSLVMKAVSLSPGLDYLMFTLFLLYKRPSIKYKYLQYVLGDDAEIAKNLGFLDVKVSSDEEGEEVVNLAIGGKGWTLVDSYYNFLSLLQGLKWPDGVEAETLLCIPHAVPAAILTYATLEAAADFLSKIDENLSAAITRRISDAIENAIDKSRCVFSLEEVLGEQAKELERAVGKENVDILFKGLSNFLIVNYVEETGTLMFDEDLLRGLRLAKEKCRPPLEKVDREVLRKWLNTLQRSLSSEA